MVKKNVEEIKSDANVAAVLAKVDRLVVKQKAREKKHGKFWMSFHKLGQWFQGHGYQRESKYTASLRDKIRPLAGHLEALAKAVGKRRSDVKK